MNTNHLYYFIKVFEQGSFTAAAKRFEISPQAVSKAINTLENELNVALFYRKGNKIIPSASGYELYTFAKEFERKFKQLENRVEQLENLKQYHINLVVSTGVLGFLGTTFVKNLENILPDIEFTIREMSDKSCEEEIITHRADFAITVAPYDKEFNNKTLYDGFHYLWINTANPLSKLNRIQPKDLDNEIIAGVSTDFNGTKLFNSAMSEYHVKVKTFLQSSEMVWLFEYAKQNLASSLTVLHQTQLLKASNVVAKKLDWCPWTFGLNWKKGKEFTEFDERFYTYVINSSKKCRDLK